MSQQPGYLTVIKKGGAAVAITSEPCTRITPNTVYRITDSTKRVLDPAVAVTVEVDPLGTASWEAAGAHTVDPYTGTVTFVSDQGGSALVRVTASYIPLLTVTTARASNLKITRDELETSAFGSAWRQFIAGRLAITGDLELVEDGLTDHDSGAGTQKFVNDLVSGAPAFLQITPGGGAKSIRTWALLTAAGNNIDGDQVVTTSLSFRAAGRGTAPSASYAA